VANRAALDEYRCIERAIIILPVDMRSEPRVPETKNAKKPEEKSPQLRPFMDDDLEPSHAMTGTERGHDQADEPQYESTTSKEHTERKGTRREP
jgi:hypothetical protein